MMRVPYPGCPSDLSPGDFGFFNDAEGQTKKQIIMSEDGLEDKLTELWETAYDDLLESVFDEWISR
jgi:hypothetical protein